MPWRENDYFIEHEVAAIAENLFLICAYLREVMWKQACLYSYLT